MKIGFVNGMEGEMDLVHGSISIRSRSLVNGDSSEPVMACFDRVVPSYLVL